MEADSSTIETLTRLIELMGETAALSFDREIGGFVGEAIHGRRASPMTVEEADEMWKRVAASVPETERDHFYKATQSPDTHYATRNHIGAVWREKRSVSLTTDDVLLSFFRSIRARTTKTSTRSGINTNREVQKVKPIVVQVGKNALPDTPPPRTLAGMGDPLPEDKLEFLGQHVQLLRDRLDSLPRSSKEYADTVKSLDEVYAEWLQATDDMADVPMPIPTSSDNETESSTKSTKSRRLADLSLRDQLAMIQEIMDELPEASEKRRAMSELYDRVYAECLQAEELEGETPIRDADGEKEKEAVDSGISRRHSIRDADGEKEKEKEKEIKQGGKLLSSCTSPSPSISCYVGLSHDPTVVWDHIRSQCCHDYGLTIISPEEATPEQRDEWAIIRMHDTIVGYTPQGRELYSRLNEMRRANSIPYNTAIFYESTLPEDEEGMDHGEACRRFWDKP